MSYSWEPGHIEDADENDIAKLVVGHRIVNIDPDRQLVELDDGTKLEFEDTSSCCAWFEVELKPHLDYRDNIITGVSSEDIPSEKDDWDAPEEHYVIHVLSHDKAILDAEVTGDPTSGYYCHSFDLRVTPVERVKTDD